MSDGESLRGCDVLRTTLSRVQEAARNGASPDILAPMLNDLIRLSAEHFATEERVLRRYGYKHARARAARHARLLRRTPDLRARLSRGEQTPSDLLDFLRSLFEQIG